MIRAVVNRDGRKHIVLGLTRENVRRMEDGDPIAFKTDDLGVPGDVFLYVAGEGQTETDMLMEFSERGVKFGELRISPRLIPDEPPEGT